MRILFISILFTLYACTQHSMSALDVLAGTWKIEGKDTYEAWEKNGKNELSGISYKLYNNQKKILETLRIKMTGSNIVYEATVPDQNDGKTIRFTLNQDIKSHFSFENPEHDFPKKIVYKIISRDEIKVNVSGNNGKGFSYMQLREK